MTNNMNTLDNNTAPLRDSLAEMGELAGVFVIEKQQEIFCEFPLVSNIPYWRQHEKRNKKR